VEGYLVIFVSDPLTERCSCEEKESYCCWIGNVNFHMRLHLATLLVMLQKKTIWSNIKLFEILQLKFKINKSIQLFRTGTMRKTVSFSSIFGGVFRQTKKYVFLLHQIFFGFEIHVNYNGSSFVRISLYTSFKCTKLLKVKRIKIIKEEHCLYLFTSKYMVFLYRQT